MKHHTVLLEDGFRVGVSEVGDEGPTLVFLHGLSVSAPTYQEVLVRLADHGFRVVALDAANHGRSDSLPWGHTVADMTEVTLKALDVLDIHRAIFAGHSMGGGMVVDIAARFPDRVLAAVLLDAAAGEEFHDSIKVGRYRTLGIRAASKLAGAFIDVFGDGVDAMKIRSARERLSLLETLRSGVAGFRFVRAAYALMRSDTTPLLKAMSHQSVPTAVLHGINDQIVPYEAGLTAAHLTGASFYGVNGFHSWLLADPELAADLITLAMLDLYPMRWVQGAG
ncbi:esterase/lipase [Mycobacterium phage MissWhite]|nr:esterase/lipase [Mycobacterium phage MissWhite]